MKDPAEGLMAIRARAVIEDCRSALIILHENPRGAQWRLTWCSTLTLLRVVGHVLKSESGAAGKAPEFKKVVENWWIDLKKKKPIIWQFIEDDRNVLLKEYRFTAEQGLVRPPTINSHAIGTMPIGIGILEPTYRMKSGPFKGRDQRDVVEIAIKWWESEIEEIELQASADAISAKILRGG